MRSASARLSGCRSAPGVDGMLASRICPQGGAGGACSTGATTGGASGAIVPRVSAGCVAATARASLTIAGFEAIALAAIAFGVAVLLGTGAIGPRSLGAALGAALGVASGAGNAGAVPMLLDAWLAGSRAAPL